MRRTVRSICQILVLSLCSVPLVASADPAPAGSAKEGHEAHKDLKDAKKELGEARDALRDGGAHAREHLKAARKEVQEARKKLSETRKERRMAARDALKTKLGDALRRPAVKEELRLHARRLARLEYMKKLAQTDDKKDLVTRLDKLVAKENERHQKHIDALKADGGAK